MSDNIIVLSRDVDALLIPSGAHIFLQMGTEVTITQELGNTYTVNIYGNLARIAAKDADALGKKPSPTTTELPPGVSLEEAIWAQMKTCFDPEIPVNIVDLGLIYACQIIEQAQGQHVVEIKMTLTAAGCGMGPVIAGDVKQKILSLPSIQDVNVEVVFDPPWDRSKMSDAAKLELGMF